VDVAGGRVYVTNQLADTLSVIEDSVLAGAPSDERL
jgi:hypothetical protein